MMSPRWSVNISPVERGARISLGLVGIIGGVLLLAGSPPGIVAVLESLLILAGADLVVTGMTGHCPLYAWLARRSVQADRRS